MNLKKGDLVKHKIFGIGRVSAVSKIKKEFKLTINFGGNVREIMSSFVEKGRMNAIFVANKPAGMSSNHFLGRLKRRYGVKKAGFSGTLDPFASGCLIVAFGSYTKIFLDF